MRETEREDCGRLSPLDWPDLLHSCLVDIRCRLLTSTQDATRRGLVVLLGNFLLAVLEYEAMLELVELYLKASIEWLEKSRKLISTTVMEGSLEVTHYSLRVVLASAWQLSMSLPIRQDHPSLSLSQFLCLLSSLHGA